jgi:hypothetical protein
LAAALAYLAILPVGKCCRARPGRPEVVQCICIILFMTTIAVMGTWQAVQNIISQY